MPQLLAEQTYCNIAWSTEPETAGDSSDLSLSSTELITSPSICCNQYLQLAE
ncbi:MAG: hypothetical protein KME05_13305 [Gloeocapsa sp. UFS-A4-WI-NPMV-4B04]|jgi:hypothetical protein|nr:hypothetical protein [Gloeocapsa sp. UFS-A4-WI-NPMV-4B04]